LLLLSGIALAQAAKPAEPHTINQVLAGDITNLENEFVPAAQQVKHVAAVNYIIAAGILEEKPPVDTGGEKGPDAVASKAEIMKFLKDSFAYVHKAAASINDKNAVSNIKDAFGEGTTTRLALATAVAWHGFDHYGQMVEYLRMNGIIPPASRH